MLALHRFMKDPANSVVSLVNMCDSEGERSRSHGIGKDWVKKQATQIGLPLVQPVSDRGSYEVVFKDEICRQKELGAQAGVFGDIYLEEHRVWINRVCREMGIAAIFPLWGEPTKDLLLEFIEEGFRTVLVAINTQKLDDSWLGREITKDFYKDIIGLDGIDPCAENGEYHTFVYDGPLFKEPVRFEKGKKSLCGNQSHMALVSPVSKL